MITEGAARSSSTETAIMDNVRELYEIHDWRFYATAAEKQSVLQALSARILKTLDDVPAEEAETLTAKLYFARGGKPAHVKDN